MFKDMRQSLYRVYILHGWTYDLARWELFLKSLRSKDIQTHLLHIPGLTSSLKNIWTLDGYAKWLKKKLNKDNKNVLLGHSFGGQIAIRCTAKYPKNVYKLILISSSGIRDKSFLTRLKRSAFFILAKIGRLFTNNEGLRKIIYHDYVYVHFQLNNAYGYGLI